VATVKGRTCRLQMDVSESELKAIDDFRFQCRLPNRAAAVRALLKSGMASDRQADTPPTEAT
jgi:hypothetical protein